MPSKNKEILNKNAKKHWEKIKDDPEVKRKARERAKAWYEANKEKAKKYMEENKEKRKEQLKAWKAANPEKVKEQRAKSQKKHQKKATERVKKYQKTEHGRIVSYAVRDSYRRRIREQSLNMFDKEKIIEIYKKCKEINLLTGESYQVDHIIPIKGKNVSGLHVSWNLRIIAASENRTKSNKFDVDSAAIDS